jgi:hypothetical protein
VKRGLLGLIALALPLWFVAPASAGGRLSAADRKSINHTIDILVNHAVKRHDPAAAYDIVTPTLRAGTTRKEWATGSIPVYPYPARGTSFGHAWNLKYVTPGEVAVELMLQPTKGQKVGPILFDIYLQPSHGRWLVDSFMPVATFAPLNARHTKVRAVNDFMPLAGRGPFSAPTGHGRVSSVVAYIPFAVIGALLLALFAGFAFGGLRYRPRAQKLPPAPGSRRTQ